MYYLRVNRNNKQMCTLTQWISFPNHIMDNDECLRGKHHHWQNCSLMFGVQQPLKFIPITLTESCPCSVQNVSGERETHLKLNKLRCVFFLLVLHVQHRFVFIEYIVVLTTCYIWFRYIRWSFMRKLCANHVLVPLLRLSVKCWWFSLHFGIASFLTMRKERKTYSPRNCGRWKCFWY